MKVFKTTMVFIGILGLFASCAHFSESSFGAYSDAEKLFEKGKYGAALVKYQQYLNENPQGNMGAIAEYSIAKCHLMLQKPEDARVSFEKVIQDYPQSSWAEFSKKQITLIETSQKPQ